MTVPIVIVQHMPAMFTKSLAEDLDRTCSLTVCEAVDGQKIGGGEVWIAPGGKQMRVERCTGGNVIRITDDPPERNCRPSVDYLFRSLATHYGATALGVMMTGMGDDGAIGCRLLREKGAQLIAQDEQSCVVFGMPRIPIQEGLVDCVVPLSDLADKITAYVSRGQLACS
jgi:two-component system chemotaxis response regulator CheB